jgi:hypothetical protein
VNGRLLGLLVCLVVLPLPAPALAWGDMGHRVIRETAFQELEPAARERMGPKVDVILMQNAVFDSAKIREYVLYALTRIMVPPSLSITPGTMGQPETPGRPFREATKGARNG